MKSNIRKIRKGCKDNFHAFLVKDAKFDGFYDIPMVIQPPNVELPKRLISYEQLPNHIWEKGDCIHFYIDDQKFDGPKGIWNGLVENQDNKRGFKLEKFNGASSIILPDFSLYLDMPRAMQIWNVYRSRAVGVYLSKMGHTVIPNVRWTDKTSYRFAFKGISTGSIVAVGSLGCSKNRQDKALFVNGFIEMIKVLKPSCVIIYGTIFKELHYVIKKYDVKYVNFESNISMIFKGENYGNESK